MISLQHKFCFSASSRSLRNALKGKKTDIREGFRKIFRFESSKEGGGGRGGEGEVGGVFPT